MFLLWCPCVTYVLSTSAVGGGSGVSGVSCEADLVVADDVDGTMSCVVR